MVEVQEGLDAAVARGATSLYFSSIALLLVNTAYFATLTNILPTEKIGVLAGINVIIWGVATLANLSLPHVLATNLPLPPAVAKIVPEFLSSGSRGRAVTVFRLSIMISVAISSALSSIIVFQADWLVRVFFQETAEPTSIYLTALAAWLFTIGQLLMMTLVGFSRTATAGIYYTISFAVKYTVGAALVLVGWELTGVLLGLIIGEILMILLCAKTLRPLVSEPSMTVSFAQVAKYSLPILVSSLVVYTVTQIDKFFALFSLSVSHLGIYNVAVAASTIAAFAPNAISVALLPRLSSHHAAGDMDSFLRLAKRYTRYVSIVAIPMSIQLASLSTAITQIFGGQYLVASTSAAILSAAVGLTAVFSVHSGCLLATERAGRIMLGNVLGLAAFLLSVSLLLGWLGFEALAWSRVAMILVIAVGIAAFSRRQGYFVMDWRAYATALLASILMGGLLFTVVSIVGGYLRLLVLLPILIPLGTVVYFALLRLAKTFDDEDISFLRSLLPTRLLFISTWIAVLAGVNHPRGKERPG